MRTGAGVKTCTLTSHEDSSLSLRRQWGNLTSAMSFRSKLRSARYGGIPVSMGNPHFVVFVDEFSPGWQGDGAEIGKHHDFKHGINVEFVKVRDRENIEVRFYERGVGETQSSGTGSCASAVASIFSKRAESPVRVHAPGGAQTVRWEGEVFLRGPAQIVCRGEYLI